MELLEKMAIANNSIDPKMFATPFLGN